MTPPPAPKPSPFKPRLKRLSYRILRFLAFLYLAIAIVFYLLQEKLIFPGAATQGTPDALVTPPPDSHLLTLPTPDGQKVTALFGRAQTSDGQPLPNAAAAPTLLFFYGNGMCLNDTLDEFREFRKLGANVLIPDYLGFGMSTGSPSEKSCYATADAAWHYLTTQSDLDPKKIIVTGWSLGAAVAVDLAARQPVAGLAMFSAFTSMHDLGSHLYPFLPVSLLLKHRFDSLQKIPHITCPLVLGHGMVDNMIPFYMSDQLAAAAPAPPLVRIRSLTASHNDFLSTADDQIQSALKTLIAHANQPPH